MESFCPVNKKAWRKWLKANHIKEDSIWLVIHKQGSANPNLTWSEAVDEALCFGWIDSVKRSIDDEKYKQYFSKRKANSTWSKINKDKVEYLIEQDLMTDAGFASIDRAKSNGSWSILDDVEALVLPDDLQYALGKRKGALSFYENLSKSAKKGLLYYVISAKRVETREKRVAEIAKNAGEGTLPKQFR